MKDTVRYFSPKKKKVFRSQYDILGNALALLDADTQAKEIQTFTDNLRRVIRFAQQKAGSDIKPS